MLRGRGPDRKRARQGLAGGLSGGARLVIWRADPRMPVTMARRTYRTANGLTLLQPSDPRMRVLKRAGHVAEIHGDRVWDSSFLLMRHLEHEPLARGARVLEIGCGWGLLGQFCAQRFGARVHGIDADPNVLPYLDLHAAVNGVTMTAERRRFEQLTSAFLSDFDVVLGADICFWDALVRPLYNLVRRARRAGVGRILIADPGRVPFQALASRCKRQLDAVARVALDIRRPVHASGEVLAIG